MDKNLLTQGIAAAKSGNRDAAYQLLTRATQDESLAEGAWLWLSSVVDHDSERLFCLDHVLRINPANEPARRGSAMLRKQGAVPSTPMPPSAPAGMPAVPPAPQAAAAPVSPPARLKPIDAPVIQSATPAPASPSLKQDLAAVYDYAALELSAKKKTPKALTQELVGRGFSAENAARIVSQAEQSLGKARSRGYRNRMTRGCLWTIAGVAVTAATFVFADQLGGSFYLCYGAIIIGLIDFLAGLAGWLFNR